MRYPAEFETAANAPDALQVWTVAGPPDEGNPTAARYVLVNVGVLWPVSGLREVPAGETIVQSPHPLTFVPFRYEVYRPEERELLGRADLSMRLMRLPTP